MSLCMDELKLQAKALTSALRTSGAAQLSPAQALDAIARIHGMGTWRKVLMAGGIGIWNASQLAVHRAYPGTVRIAEGKSYVGSGDMLYESLMHLAHSQPRARLRKTLAAWSREVDHLQQAVRDAMLIDEPYAPGALELPKGLAPTFTAYLQYEFAPANLSGWADAGERLERVRKALYAVQAALLPVPAVGGLQALMMLESLHGAPMPLGVPVGMDISEAYRTAEDVISSLHARAVEVPDNLFAFDVVEMKVLLANAGFSTLAPVMTGPIWD